MGNAVPSISTLLNPTSIAVIGASRNPVKFGYQIIETLVSEGYTGRVYPINPGTESICGLKCYSSIIEVPEPVDVAVIVVPAEQVLRSCQDCAAQGVKAVVIIASGFAEAGAKGQARESSLAELAKTTGMRIVGPNCEGVLNLHARMVLSFSAMFRGLKAGPVSIVSHSGGYCGIVSRRLQNYGVGVSKVISSGNETDLRAVDYLEYLAEDQDTKVIACYMEQIREPRRFMDVARNVTRRTPIVINKTGRSEIGKKAAASHTASLAGSDRVVDAVFKQVGVVRVYDLQELIDAAAALGTQPLMKGRRVGILSGTGGLAVEMADLCVEGGLEVPDLSETTKNELSKLIPYFGFTFNPVDMTGVILSQPEAVGKALQVVVDDEKIDAVAFIITIARQVEFAQEIYEVVKRSPKPVLICWTGGREVTPEPVEYLMSRGVPIYDTPVRVRDALKALAAYSRYRLRVEENQQEEQPGFGMVVRR